MQKLIWVQSLWVVSVQPWKIITFALGHVVFLQSKIKFCDSFASAIVYILFPGVRVASIDKQAVDSNS